MSVFDSIEPWLPPELVTIVGSYTNIGLKLVEKTVYRDDKHHMFLIGSTIVVYSDDSKVGFTTRNNTAMCLFQYTSICKDDQFVYILVDTQDPANDPSVLGCANGHKWCVFVISPMGVVHVIGYTNRHISAVVGGDSYVAYVTVDNKLHTLRDDTLTAASISGIGPGVHEIVYTSVCINRRIMVSKTCAIVEYEHDDTDNAIVSVIKQQFNDRFELISYCYDEDGCTKIGSVECPINGKVIDTSRYGALVCGPDGFVSLYAFSD